MKIKKHGKLFNKETPVHTEKFKCEACGCEFTCKDDEYYTHAGGADWTYASGSITTTACTISSTIRDYLVCSCPECHKIVKKVHERQRDNLWYTTTTNPYTYVKVKEDSWKPSDDKFRPGEWTITCNTISSMETGEL